MSKKTTRQLEVEINQLLSKIESSDYDDIQQMIADYEQAKKLVDILQKRLTDAENTIKKISKS